MNGKGRQIGILALFVATSCLQERFELSESTLVTRPLCTQAAQYGFMRCHARTRTDEFGRAAASSAPIPGSLTPADLRRAYAIAAGGGRGMTVAVVAASDNPKAASDLAVYREQFHLTPCTEGDGCFEKVNQRGESAPLPPPDEGWAGEIALDVDMVSATCPRCRILLVEADSPSDADLGEAVNTAVTLGADVVSMSFGGPENETVVADAQRYYSHPGVLLVAAGGDDGYDADNPEFPASAQGVLAVGGTTLVAADGTRGFREEVWNSNGGASNSGCSRFIDKPAYQGRTRCATRALNDVAAFADPEIGVAVYDSFDLAPGWGAFGGTSAATPIVAGIFAATGNASASPAFAYQNLSAFFDVTRGSDAVRGTCRDGSLCKAGPGYDGPTGVGSPNAEALAKLAAAARTYSFSSR
jgi:subtilase family serine protease